METKEKINKLRIQLISANQRYVDEIRKGKNLDDLKDLNKEINGLIALIQYLEESNKPTGD